MRQAIKIFVKYTLGTYRQVLHLTITVCRKLQDKVDNRTNIISTVKFFWHFLNLKERVPAEPGVLTKITFLFYGPVQ